jgi:hypothetical protein
MHSTTTKTMTSSINGSPSTLKSTISQESSKSLLTLNETGHVHNGIDGIGSGHEMMNNFGHQHGIKSRHHQQQHHHHDSSSPPQIDTMVSQRTLPIMARKRKSEMMNSSTILSSSAVPQTFRTRDERGGQQMIAQQNRHPRPFSSSSHHHHRHHVTHESDSHYVPHSGSLYDVGYNKAASAIKPTNNPSSMIDLESEADVQRMVDAWLNTSDPPTTTNTTTSTMTAATVVDDMDSGQHPMSVDASVLTQVQLHHPHGLHQHHHADDASSPVLSMSQPSHDHPPSPAVSAQSPPGQQALMDFPSMTHHHSIGIDAAGLFDKWIHPKKMRELGQSLGIQFKEGRYSKKEDEILKRTIAEYSERHGLTHEHIAEFMSKQRGEKRDPRTDEFWSELHRALPHRMLYSIYHHARRIFHPLNYVGQWTADEDELLLRLVGEHGHRWELIGRQLGRLGQNCKDHYREIRENFARGPWTPTEEDRLRMAMIDMYPEGVPYTHINWNEVAKKVPTRSVRQCRIKWYFGMSNKRTDTSRWKYEDDLELIQRVYRSGAKDVTEIRWDVIPDEGFPRNPALCHRHFWMLMKRLPNYEKMEFEELLERLMNDCRHVLESEQNPSTVDDSHTGIDDQRHEEDVHHDDDVVVEDRPILLNDSAMENMTADTRISSGSKTRITSMTIAAVPSSNPHDARNELAAPLDNESPPTFTTTTDTSIPGRRRRPRQNSQSMDLPSLASTDHDSHPRPPLHHQTTLREHDRPS